MSQTHQAPVPDEQNAKIIINHGAKDVPFYTPAQDPPAGTAWDPQPDKAIFSPLKVRDLTLHNRIIVSPMCQ